MATITPIDGFITLDNIINNFLISYTGPGKLIPDAKRTEVVFHARRCLQEFAYETLKSQINVNLRIPNVSYIYTIPSDSITIAAITIDQFTTSVSVASTIGTVINTSGSYIATVTTAVAGGFSTFLVGDVISGTSGTGTFGTGPLTITSLNSTTSINVSSPTVFTAGTVTITSRVSNILMTETATNPPVLFTEYYISRTSKKQSTVVFSSALTTSYSVNIKYLSNALTNDENALIPKLAEEALYSCIVYAVLANRENTNPNVLQRLLIEKIDKLERSKSRLIFTNFTT